LRIGGAEVTTTEIPASAGTYTMTEASLYLRATFSGTRIFPVIHPQHLSRWSRDGLGNEGVGRDISGTRTVNFLELISFRLVAAMRAHGVSAHDIRLANCLLREKWDWKYPFAMHQMWIGSPDIFVEIDGAPVAVIRF
jgi:hypothetical protein